MRPDSEIIASGKIWDIEPFPGIGMTGLLKLPDCKTCSVVWTRASGGLEHVSISPKHKFSVPSWSDMCILKDLFFYDEEEAYQVHPPKSEYVNLMENCLHLWRIADGTRITDIARRSEDERS